MARAQRLADLSATQQLQYSQLAYHMSDISQMLEAAQLQPHETVLDYGTGIGRAVQLAAPECRFAVGVDCDAAVIDLAILETKAKGIKNCDFWAIDEEEKMGGATWQELIQDLVKGGQIDDPRFDVVFVCWTMHHIKSTTHVQVLEDLKRFVLKPTGRILLDVQAPQKYMRTIELTWGVKQDNGRINAWHTWRRERVGNQQGIKDARKALMELAKSSNCTVQSWQAFPDHERGKYADVTSEIMKAAQAKTTKQGEAINAGELEVARKERMCELATTFPRSTAFPRDVEAWRVQYWAQHKVAAVMGVLVHRT